MVPPYRTWVEVSRSALHWNFGQFQRFFNNQAQICPVVKSNAYGIGSAWVVKNLADKQIWGFCVAFDTEAEELYPLVKKHSILVLSSWLRENLPSLIKKKIRLVAWDEGSLRVISSEARKLKRDAYVHLKLDTGTTRVGVRPEQAITIKRVIEQLPQVIVEGVFSHYANSEAKNLSFARRQQRLFLGLCKTFTAHYHHIACTAASIRLPLRGTNLVRLGLGLYGLWPSQSTTAVRGITLRPVLSWKTRLLQMKRVPAGTTVGYDRTYRVRAATTIGVLPIGYADGYDRRASNRSWVIIQGRRIPVIGRVGMNLTMVDLGTQSLPPPGAEVQVIGRGVSADDLAQSWNTINYEVVSRISPLLPRIEIP